MKFTEVKQIKEFLSAVDQCQGSVWLESKDGDRYNLKSELSQYIAIAALLKEKGEQLELFCSQKDDEPFMFQFLHEHPEVV